MGNTTNKSNRIERDFDFHPICSIPVFNVEYLYLLNDNCIAIIYCFALYISAPKRDYKCHKIKLDRPVSQICQIDNSNIIMATPNKSLHIYSKTKQFLFVSQISFNELYGIDNSHEDTINNLVALSRNRFASSDSTCLKIWNGQVPYTETPITIINKPFKTICCHKERELLICNYENKELHIISTKTYQYMLIIENKNYCNADCLILREQLVLKLTCEFVFVNLDTFKCKEINIYDYISCRPITMINNDMILVAKERGIFGIFDIKKEKYYKLETIHMDDWIDGLLQIDEETFLAKYQHQQPKIWKCY